jgi:hypothetical protein
MCNLIHQKTRLLPDSETEGIGYKIFQDTHDGRFYPMMPWSNDVFNTAGGNKWKDDRYPGDGFCFFFSRGEAERLLSDWMNSCTKPSSLVIHRIFYKEGVCEQDEPNIISGKTYVIGLCRYFEIRELIVAKSNY